MTKRTLVFALLLCFIFFLNVVCSYAQSSPIFGPKTYTRAKGKPEKTVETFNICAASGQYRLTVENGYYAETKHGKKKTKVSAGAIEINGKEVVEEDDFRKKVAKIGKNIDLVQGENRMEVELEGKPGA